jgi:hypothetical protein
MSSRIRYLSSIGISRKKLRVTSDELSRKEYSDELAWGFVDIRNEGDVVTGTFIERFESEEQIAHPFGEITNYKRVHFSHAKFWLGVKVPQLEVYDGSRSLAPLLTELSRCFQFSLAFSRIRIDLQTLIGALKRKTSSLTLFGASLADITLASDVFARVAVVGSGEVGPYLKTAALGRDLKLERICLRGTFHSKAFKIEVTADARIHVHAGYEENLIRTLRGVVIESLL